MVCWIHQHVDLWCVGRIRSADHDCRAWLRRGSGIAGVDSGHEQSVAALSSRAVATDNAIRNTRRSVRFPTNSPPPAAWRPVPLTISICLSARYQMPPARCMVVRNGRLRNRRRMGLRKRFRPRAASSNRSGDSSDANGFRTNAVMRWQSSGRFSMRGVYCEQQRTARHRTPCLKGVRRARRRLGLASDQ